MNFKYAILAFLLIFGAGFTTTQAQDKESITPLVEPIDLFEKIPQTPKEEVIELIKNWYTQHPDAYALDIEEEAVAYLDDYHNDDSPDLLRVRWNGMLVTLAFNKNLKEIKLTPANLKKHFNYIVLDNIYHDIEIEGWDIHPRTPSSSNSKGVKFSTTKEGKLQIDIDWEMYTIFGYSQTGSCKMRMQRTDTATPKDCYVGHRQRLPLKFKIVVDTPQ